MTQVRLDRVGGVGKAATVLVMIAAAAGVLNWVAAVLAKDDAAAFIAGEISSDDFSGSLALFNMSGLLSAAATVASAILVIIWMYRIASNHKALQRTGTWSPGWAIGGWFLPPFLYVIPYLMFRELWKASDPDVPIGADWKSGSVAPVVTAWFVVFGPISVVVQFASASSDFEFGTSNLDVAEQIVDSQSLLAASGIIGVVAAGLFVVMARTLTRRHQRLIGEPAR